MSEFGGEEPDTFDGRLQGIARLISTLPDEIVEDRRKHRVEIIERLLDELLEEAELQIDTQRARLK